MPRRPDPERPRPVPKVYLAGKISKENWRYQLVSNWGEADPDDALTPTYRVTFERFILTGPFFLDCRHGLIENTHGTDSVYNRGWDEDEENAGIERWDLKLETLPLRGRSTHALVQEVSFKRIAAADFIFAYVNESDCFGTLVELGYAKAIGRPVYLCFGRAITEKRRADMWFIEELAAVVSDSRVDHAFEEALQHWGSRSLRRRKG